MPLTFSNACSISASFSTNTLRLSGVTFTSVVLCGIMIFTTATGRPEGPARLDKDRKELFRARETCHNISKLN